MLQIFHVLAPRSWTGVLHRTVPTVLLIFGMNLAFARYYGGAIDKPLSYYFWGAVMIGGPFVVVFFASSLYQVRLQKRLSLLSRKDGLTGLNNRRTFMDLANQRLGRIGRGVLFLLDADHFKRINDTYGHSVGDHCLEEIAHRLKWNMRNEDVAGRIGGEEFGVYLAGATIEQARVIAGRIGQPITFQTGNGDECKTLTLSLGAVQVSPDLTLHDLLVRADDALYAAKRTGRAKLIIWEDGLDIDELKPQSVA